MMGSIFIKHDTCFNLPTLLDLFLRSGLLNDCSIIFSVCSCPIFFLSSIFLGGIRPSGILQNITIKLKAITVNENAINSTICLRTLYWC